MIEAEVYRNLFSHQHTISVNSYFLIVLSQGVYEKCAFNFRVFCDTKRNTLTVDSIQEKEDQTVAKPKKMHYRRNWIKRVRTSTFNADYVNNVHVNWSLVREKKFFWNRPVNVYKRDN